MVRHFQLSKLFLTIALVLGSLSQDAVAAKARSVVVAEPPPKFPGQGLVKTFVNTIVESRRHLAAAAVARCVSVFTMYPVDTIKTRMQMGRKIDWGLANLYGGVGGSLFGQVPYGVLTFGSYEIYKNKLMSTFKDAPPIIVYALAAILGDVTGSGWLCPSEVVKQQIQGGLHTDTFAAIKSIWNTKGFGGFYQGYFGGLARDVPFRVAQLTSYEVTKKVYLKQKKKRIGADAEKSLELSPLDSAICGALAGTFSAAITCPLDRFKTLLMTDSATYGGNVVSCAAKIFKDEGLKGFTKGLVPRVTYIAPSVAIFFIAYEQVQQRLAGN